MTYSLHLQPNFLVIYNEKTDSTCYITPELNCSRSPNVDSASDEKLKNLDNISSVSASGSSVEGMHKTAYSKHSKGTNSPNSTPSLNNGTSNANVNGKSFSLKNINRFDSLKAQDLEEILYSGTTITDIAAIFGCIKLLSGVYICISTTAPLVTRFLGRYNIHINKRLVWIRVFAPKSIHTNIESKCLGLLNAATSKYGHFYHVGTEADGSLLWDITRSVQRQMTREDTSEPRKGPNKYFLSPNEEFFWNRHVSACFLQSELYEFVTPMIMGFVSGHETIVPTLDIPVKFWLISRLSSNRVGTRYHVRGLDETGNVANFVETEQTVMIQDEISSFLQIRGSIPLFWDQSPDLSYNPTIRIQKTNSTSGYQSHIQKTIDTYGDIVIVSLVNLKGLELTLANEFERQHKIHNNPHVRYIAWDFHKECSGMRYSNIKKLITLIDNELDQFGFFQYDEISKTIKKEQKGIIRSNCKDCLDRTNVVMSVVAKLILKRILISHNILPPNQSMNRFSPILSNHFKVLWADNGDALSLMYAGTGALKSDFTRTGKRTIFGALQDLQNSATRYYLNNFQDGLKQDAITLLLGKYEIVQPQNPFDSENSWSYFFTALWFSFFAGIFLSIVNVLLFICRSSSRGRLLDFVLWAMFTFISYLVLKKNGRDAANHPLLTMRNVVKFSTSEESKKDE